VDDGAVGEVEVAGRDSTLASNASGGDVVHAVETGSGVPFLGATEEHRVERARQFVNAEAEEGGGGGELLIF
jgi:hypothetical protein